MAARFIESFGAAAGDAATELGRLKAETTGPIPMVYDAIDGLIKYYDRLNAKVRQSLTTGMTPVTCTASTLTVTSALHASRVVTLNRAAGIAVTLPAATGSGDRYEFLVLATFTGAASIKVASATDYFIGNALLGIDGGTAIPHLYPTANTGTVSTESDTLDLFGTANSTGGIKGQRIIIQDIASAVFSIQVVGDAGGTEATPFSAAV